LELDAVRESSRVMPFAAETSASGAVEAWTSAPAGEAVIIALAIICRHICVWFLRGGGGGNRALPEGLWRRERRRIAITLR